MHSNQLMEAWLGEFSNWRTAEEENQEFAFVLCEEFQNWRTTHEEEAIYNQAFLTSYFEHLPLDVLRRIRQLVWKKQIQKQQTLVPFGFTQAPALSKRFLQNWYYYQFHHCPVCQTQRTCDRCRQIMHCN